VFKSTGLLLLTAAVIAVIGGLIQINPIWDYGPFNATTVSAPSQPDWYMGWLEGALRLFPAFEPTIFGVTIPSAFIPGVVLPGLFFGVLTLWPLIEQRVTHDFAEHHLLDNPRDMPVRTGIGVAGIVFIALLTLAGGNDVLALVFNIPIEAITWFFRVAVFIAPPAAGYAAYRIALELGRTGMHPLGRKRGVVLRRNSSGGFD
jgi:ubiquinol-cytochrome c reductase cytochrome b subunit